MIYFYRVTKKSYKLSASYGVAASCLLPPNAKPFYASPAWSCCPPSSRWWTFALRFLSHRQLLTTAQQNPMMTTATQKMTIPMATASAACGDKWSDLPKSPTLPFSLALSPPPPFPLIVNISASRRKDVFRFLPCLPCSYLPLWLQQDWRQSPPPRSGNNAPGCEGAYSAMDQSEGNRRENARLCCICFVTSARAEVIYFAGRAGAGGVEVTEDKPVDEPRRRL